MMAESLQNELKKRGIHKTVSTIITHVQVDEGDPAFGEPTKPVGPYYPESEARRHIDQGWKMQNIPGRGWRRLVPSPRPCRIIEIEAIRAEFERGIIPIASGGGGIPVVEEEGMLKGVDAVIDKDLSSSLLARELGAERLIILTDVDGVYLHWGTGKGKRLENLTAGKALEYFRDGEFPAGSMGPKIEAAVEFLQSGGEEVFIAKPEDLLAAVEGKAGTRIVP